MIIPSFYAITKKIHGLIYRKKLFGHTKGYGVGGKAHIFQLKCSWSREWRIRRKILQHE